MELKDRTSTQLGQNMKLKSPVTKMKRKVAKTTGIPTTKSGRSRKLSRLTGGASGALSGAGRSRNTKGRGGSKEQNGVGVLALVIASISGYFFGLTAGFVIFFILLVVFSIIVAKNNAGKEDEIRSPKNSSKGK